MPLHAGYPREKDQKDMPELRINSDKVCGFLEFSRELAGKVPDTTGGDGTEIGDDSPLHLAIEESKDDPTREQMVEFINGLNIEEQEDLLALIFIGRGDYDYEDWESAVAEARDRITDGDPDFMIGSPGLPEYLGEALDAFGKSCDE